MVKVTLEFSTVDETIVALGKLVGTPLKVASGPARGSVAQAPGVPTTSFVAPKPNKARRGRSDKGQQRGPYKTDAATMSGGAAGHPVDTGNDELKLSSVGVLGVTDTGKAAVEAANLISTVPSPVPVAPEPIKTAAPDVPTTSGLIQPAETPAAAVPVYKQADIQAAVQKIFAEKGLDTALRLMQQFGATSYSKIKPEQYVEFMTKVGEVLVA